MDELSKKLVELIEKGEGAVEAHGMELTAKWVEYVVLYALWNIFFGLVLLAGFCGLAFLARFLFRWSREIKEKKGGLDFDAGIGTFIAGVLAALGAVIMGSVAVSEIMSAMPVFLEPVGYLVNQIARAAL